MLEWIQAIATVGPLTTLVPMATMHAFSAAGWAGALAVDVSTPDPVETPALAEAPARLAPPERVEEPTPAPRAPESNEQEAPAAPAREGLERSLLGYGL